MDWKNEKWAIGLWSGVVWLFNFRAPNPDEMALRVSIWFLVILTIVATILERRKYKKK